MAWTIENTRTLAGVVKQEIQEQWVKAMEVEKLIADNELWGLSEEERENELRIEYARLADHYHNIQELDRVLSELEEELFLAERDEQFQEEVAEYDSRNS